MEPAYTITYVTAFIDIYADQAVKDFIKKPNTMRYETFRQLAKGKKIPIVVFVDPESAKIVAEFQHECNLHIVPIYYDELITFQDIKDLELELPNARCTKKDTVEFMTIMNAKAEFMKRAKDINPFNTHHFGWMDFSLGYVFKDHENTYKYLQDICHRPLQTPLYVVPGCWQKGVGIDYIDHAINWRFCGGFYVADAKSVEDLYNLYRTHYRRMVKDKKKILWETNIWALLELDHSWNPTWFLADHNDSICKIPESCFI
jgi:hypothetical protein